MYCLPWQGLCVCGVSVLSIVLFECHCCLCVWSWGVGCLGLSWIYGDSSVRQRSNESWNNIHRKARLPNAMCIDMQAQILFHCQGLCRHFSPCPLVFPRHVTCHQTQRCVFYLPPCPFNLFRSFFVYCWLHFGPVTACLRYLTTQSVAQF